MRIMIPPLIVLTLALAACGPPKQTIPISTNPLGALVYADGVKTCTTPCAVTLTKDREHLVTIVKDGYEQVDLDITRQFRPDKAARDVLLDGILTGGDPKTVLGQAADDLDKKEKSGEAYDLVPSIIKVLLRPVRP